MNTIGGRLRLARKNARLSQAALAEASGVSQQMISKLEVGKAESTGDIVKLARACGVDADWLEDGDINNPPWHLSGPSLKHRHGEESRTTTAQSEGGRADTFFGKRQEKYAAASPRYKKAADKLLDLPEEALGHIEPLLEDLTKLYGQG